MIEESGGRPFGVKVYTQVVGWLKARAMYSWCVLIGRSLCSKSGDKKSKMKASEYSHQLSTIEQDWSVAGTTFTCSTRSWPSGEPKWSRLAFKLVWMQLATPTCRGDSVERLSGNERTSGRSFSFSVHYLLSSNCSLSWKGKINKAQLASCSYLWSLCGHRGWLEWV